MVRRLAFGAPVWGALGLMFALFACGGGGELCDADELTRALESAQPGDTVRIGNCRIYGTFTVPAGVILEGRGSENSAINGGGAAVIRLQPGGSNTTLSALMIESSGPIGVLAQGIGNAAIENVVVRASLGVGVGAEDLDHFTIQNVTVLGPVDPNNAMNFPPNATSTVAATYGVVARNIPVATLEDVEVHGFSEFGAAFLNSSVSWARGSAALNRQTGLYAKGGALDLDQVDLSGAFKALLLPAYGAILAGGVAATSDGLKIEDVDGLGLLQIASTGTHENISFARNHEEAMRLEQVNGFSVTGAITDNRIAGIVVLESANVDIHEMTISGTIQTTKASGNTLPVLTGDGIELVSSNAGISLSELTLNDNQRVGVLIELGGLTLDVNTLNNITVSGTGMQLGVIAQGGIVPPGWDDTVMRAGVIANNDSVFTGTLPTLAVTGPCDYPRPEPLEQLGLAGIISP